MKKIKQEKGITLVALVITIIVLLILAGVGIGLIGGEDGLLSKAKESAEEYNKAAIEEAEILAQLQERLTNYNNGLPENTETTEAGTEVKIPEEWYPTASVTAVATGNGETVPVPIGFYYVGGKINTGVVISDNEADKNKYANIENGDIPAGVAYNADGTVNKENSELKGNQFVWIPVTESEYVKKDWGYADTTWETQTNTAELPQIQKYGGFYIGRYEAGTSEITLSTGVDFSGPNTATNWQNDNFSIRDELGHTVTGKITSKAGEIPYYHTDYYTAVKLSNNMYKTKYVQSGLVTGAMWDAMLKFIADGNDAIVTTQSTWGNYTDTSAYVKYTVGQGRYATVESKDGISTKSAFKVSDGNYYYGIKTTGISEDVKKKNLYDVAGNLWEWTQEVAYPGNILEEYMLRGGTFTNNYSVCPVCYRNGGNATGTSMTVGFRPALYIK